jgi:hypothetical protein
MSFTNLFASSSMISEALLSFLLVLFAPRVDLVSTVSFRLLSALTFDF